LTNILFEQTYGTEDRILAYIRLWRVRYVQVWIIAKRWKQSPVGWFLKSIQNT